MLTNCPEALNFANVPSTYKGINETITFWTNKLIMLYISTLKSFEILLPVFEIPIPIIKDNINAEKTSIIGGKDICLTKFDTSSGFVINF